MTNNNYVVILDTDRNYANGITAEKKGTLTGTTLAYSFADVPAGSYYLSAVVSFGTATNGEAEAGDYVAMYGATSILTIPQTANIAVTKTETLTINLTAFVMPETTPVTEAATVSATMSLGTDLSGRPYYIAIDTDKDYSNGTTKETTGTVAGSSITYSFAEVPTGTYYLYAIVYMGSATSGNPQPGDYVAMNGAASIDSLPSDPNVSIPATGNVTVNLTALVYPSQEPGDGDEEGVTVSGTVTLPASVSNKPYTVIIDDDTNGGDGDGTPMASGTANGTSFTYTLADVPPGQYYIYAIVYTDGVAGGSPAAGDYFGAYGTTAISKWPLQTPKVTVGTTALTGQNFPIYTVTSDMGGDDPDTGDEHGYQEIGWAMYGLSVIMNRPYTNTGSALVWTAENLAVTGTSYFVTGTLTYTISTTFTTGTLTYTGGQVVEIVLIDYHGDTGGSTGGGTVTFSDGKKYEFDAGLETLTRIN